MNVYPRVYHPNGIKNLTSVFVLPGLVLHFSYETLIGVEYDGKFMVTNFPYSNTTARHKNIIDPIGTHRVAEDKMRELYDLSMEC